MNIDSLMVPELNEELIASNICNTRAKSNVRYWTLGDLWLGPKNFNRQEKNKKYKETLRCKNFTSSWVETRHLPYAFTKQGIYMLMTVLKGEYEYYLMIDYSSINDLANVICDWYFKNKEISKENIREKLENMYLWKKLFIGLTKATKHDIILMKQPVQTGWMSLDNDKNCNYLN